MGLRGTTFPTQPAERHDRLRGDYLEGRAFILLSRKPIVVTDRQGLKAAANGTYHQPEVSRFELLKKPVNLARHY